MNELPQSAAPTGLTIRAVEWLSDYWAYLLQIVGQVGLAFTVILVGARDDLMADPRDWIVSWSGGVLVCFAVVWVAGFVFTIVRTDRISKFRDCVSKLRAQLETACDQRDAAVSDYFSIIDRCLRVLANEFLELDDTERVSIYRHDGSAFVMLGRYSKHPDYRRRGRSVYADNEGCIGYAWRHGYAFVSALPDPEISLFQYLQVNEEQWQMPMHVTKELVMKSRSIVAFAIEDASGDRFAVIVFESTVADKLDFDLLQAKVRDEPEGRFLASMIQDMKPHEPSPSLASRKGF